MKKNLFEGEITDNVIYEPLVLYATYPMGPTGGPPVIAVYLTIYFKESDISKGLYTFDIDKVILDAWASGNKIITNEILTNNTSITINTVGSKSDRAVELDNAVLTLSDSIVKFTGGNYRELQGEEWYPIPLKDVVLFGGTSATEETVPSYENKNSPVRHRLKNKYDSNVTYSFGAPSSPDVKIELVAKFTNPTAVEIASASLNVEASGEIIPSDALSSKTLDGSTSARIHTEGQPGDRKHDLIDAYITFDPNEHSIKFTGGYLRHNLRETQIPLTDMILFKGIKKSNL